MDGNADEARSKCGQKLNREDPPTPRLRRAGAKGEAMSLQDVVVNGLVIVCMVAIVWIVVRG